MINDASERYADIIDLPHYRSARRIPMPREDRAAQFSSFAALTAHSAAITETERLTDARQELTESGEAELDAVLHKLTQHLECEARITWFVPDARKSGGAYRTITARLRRVDSACRCLILEDGTGIPLDDILRLSIKEDCRSKRIDDL